MQLILQGHISCGTFCYPGTFCHSGMFCDQSDKTCILIPTHFVTHESVTDRSAIVSFFLFLWNLNISCHIEDIADTIFHLDVHYVCYIMHVQRLEARGRRFTNFHYYYYYKYKFATLSTWPLRVAGKNNN